jgi:hypothetical protein
MVKPSNGPHSVVSEYREYLIHLHRSTRVHVRPPSSKVPIVEGGSDEEDPYDVITRRGVQLERASVENYMVSNPFNTFLKHYEI